jgi:hypothetical protein
MINIFLKIISAGPANILYLSTNGEIDMWYIYNLSYKSALSFHKYPSLVVDYSNLSVRGIAHPGKIPGVDNHYNQR